MLEQLTAEYIVPKRDKLIYEFTLWCEVQPLERPRVKDGRVYQPVLNQQELWKELQRYVDRGSPYLFGALHKIINRAIIVDQYYYFQRKGRKTHHPIQLQLGDEDNLRKGVNDALVKLGVIDDDKHIIGGQQYKIWDEESYVIIRIYGVKDATIRIPMLEMPECV